MRLSVANDLTQSRQHAQRFEGLMEFKEDCKKAFEGLQDEKHVSAGSTHD